MLVILSTPNLHLSVKNVTKKVWFVENGHWGSLGWASVKKAHLWKILEILYLIDTKIFQFDPLEAEKMGSKDGNPT